jgi:hypothetical protein
MNVLLLIQIFNIGIYVIEQITLMHYHDKNMPLCLELAGTTHILINNVVFHG